MTGVARLHDGSSTASGASELNFRYRKESACADFVHAPRYGRATFCNGPAYGCASNRTRASRGTAKIEALALRDSVYGAVSFATVMTNLLLLVSSTVVAISQPASPRTNPDTAILVAKPIAASIFPFQKLFSQRNVPEVPLGNAYPSSLRA